MLQTASPAKPEARGLLPIAIATLRSQTRVAFDLYLWPDRRQAPLLYRARDVILEADDLQRLTAQGIATLYTRSADAQDYCQHVREHVVSDESLPPMERYNILKDATRTVLNDALVRGQIDNVLAVGAELGRDIVSLVCGRQSVLRDVLSVMTHDYSTFTHMVNVCTSSVILAEAYGIRDRQSLAELAQGALLHDIGKCFIPGQVLNKSTPLSPEEQDAIRVHPTRGFEELCRRDDVTWGLLMMVYQHHERINGSGYPVGLVGREIHEWGRLCAITDVYDALTRDRPYRRGADTKDVVEYLDREAGRSFDEDMCRCWISALKQCE